MGTNPLPRSGTTYSNPSFSAVMSQARPIRNRDIPEIDTNADVALPFHFLFSSKSLF